VVACFQSIQTPPSAGSNVWQQAMFLLKKAGQGDEYTAFKKHLEALVTLGYFEKLEFHIQHIAPGTPKWKDLYRALIQAEDFQNVGDGFFEMSGYEEQTKREVVIWVRPGNRAKYESIISRFDRTELR
jgi:hypothetical protein